MFLMTIKSQKEKSNAEDVQMKRLDPPASVASVTVRGRGARDCGGGRVVGLRAGRVQSVGGCLRSGAGRARRHRQAQHVHQSLSHRVAVGRLVRGVGRAALLSLVHPGNSSSNH